MSEYVKFSCQCAHADITFFGGLAELNEYRRKLLQLRLIGVDSNGTGFGNLSIRDDATDNFYITGSATAAMPELALADCELGPIRRVSDSVIGIVDSRCRLRIGCNGSIDHPLPRLRTLGRASKSRSDQLEGRRVWNTGAGI